jgi:hypothetical protein
VDLGLHGATLSRHYIVPMPFKHHVARHHHIFRARHSVTIRPAYQAGLRRRGDLTFWLDEAVLEEWTAPAHKFGRAAVLFDLAIKIVLTLRLVFYLALRMVEGFAR